MKLEELLARLEENAQTLVKPVPLTLAGIGTIYVRKRTVKEFEEMAQVRAAERDKPVDPEAAATVNVGLFGPSLARLLCEEDGKRFSPEQEAALAAVLAKQPEEIFHRIIEATDGQIKDPAKKEQVPGN